MRVMWTMRKTTTNENDNENDNENYDNDNDNHNMIEIKKQKHIIIKITKEKYFKDLTLKAHLDSAWIHSMKLSHTDSSPQILIPIPASLQFYQASSLQFG